MTDARDRTEARRIDYNEQRPHRAHGNLTPSEFIEQAQSARIVAWHLDQHWGQAHREESMTGRLELTLGAGHADPSVLG
jgi:Integrase core domain